MKNDHIDMTYHGGLWKKEDIKYYYWLMGFFEGIIAGLIIAWIIIQ